MVDIAVKIENNNIPYLGIHTEHVIFKINIVSILELKQFD